jgi:ribosomal protein S18 acetylase RimI-like enzyme
MIEPVVTLERMSPDGWKAWRAASVRTYAAEMVRVGSWPAEGAQDRADALFGRLVPDGQQTTGHEFRSIVNADGEAVGALWFAADGDAAGDRAFLWDIAIDPEQRGRGYGRAAMEAFETLARSLGYHAIRLNVFADNTVARALYDSVGYTETSLAMHKNIG